MSEGLQFAAVMRPFINRSPLAYELVLVRSDGQRFFEKRLAILSGTDASDLAATSPTIRFERE